MHLRLRDTLVVDHAKWNAAKLRQTRRFVPKRGSARTAEDPETIPGVVLGDAAARSFHREVSRLDQAPCRMRAEFPLIGPTRFPEMGTT